MCVKLYSLISQIDLILILFLCDSQYLAEGLLLEFLNIAIMIFAFMHLDISIDLSECFSQSGVEIILDVVVGTTRQLLCDLRPFVSHLLLHAK